MTFSSLTTRRQLLTLGIPAILISALILIANSSQLVANPSIISIGITLDLLLTVPLIYYLLIRKTKISKNTVFIMTAFCLLISYKIIPTEHQTVFPFLKTWLLPIAEIGIIGYIIVNLRKAKRNYQFSKSSNADFYTGAKGIAGDILPAFFARIMATEIAVIYYGVFYWKKRELKVNEFTSHKKSSSTSIFLGIILIIGVETTVFHYILEQEGNSRAWVITILSIYSLLQLLGFLKSLIKRPIDFIDNKLYLRYGIMKETTIDLHNISSITLSSKTAKEKMSRLSLFGKLESHNVIIYLKEKETLYGIYGIRKRFKTISFYVDEPQQFFDMTCVTIEQLKKLKE